VVPDWVAQEAERARRAAHPDCWDHKRCCFRAADPAAQGRSVRKGVFCADADSAVVVGSESVVTVAADVAIVVAWAVDALGAGGSPAPAAGGRQRWMDHEG